MIVVDASALVLALLGGEGGPLALRIFAPGMFVAAPQIVDLEIAQTLRRLLAARRLLVAEAEDVMADLSLSPINRFDHEPLLPRIWSLRDNLSAYDAAYVALAEELGAPLLSRDARLAAATGHGAQIELV